MKSLTYITLSIFFLTVSLGPQWNISSKAFLPIEENTLLVCPNPCQTTDSLALIAIYNATSGPGWTNLWDTSLPVCTPWDGVELDDDGFVTRLTLNNNNLIGSLPPEIGNFSRIEELQLDNNLLSGTIPPEIGNLGELEICFLDNNNFVGTIPDEFGNLSMMHTLYLDNNQLVGAIPSTFLSLNNLFKFDIFNNNFDSIPDLSSINLQPNKFRIYNNEFTFDDIVLNNLTALGTFYTPQDSVNQASTVNLLTGDDYILDLDFDNGITDNIYQWYKDGAIYGGPTNSNKLPFSPVTWATAGEYRCQVTNPNASLLTLHTRPVTINVNCGVSTFSLNDTLCHGGSIEFNAVTYDASNPTGFFSLPGEDQYGCDSLIIINLNFRPENIFELNETICNDDSIVVNNVVYNQANPNGTEILLGEGQHGCDSIVEINLTFYTAAAAGNLSPIICPGDSIELFGIFYDQDQPTGTVVLNNATATSCDSTIFIEVQFYPQAIGNYSPTICEGGSVMVGGQPFDETTPSGQVNLGPVSQNGCDSLVNVNLSFFGPSEGTYEEVLCFGDSANVNGTIYNQANPSGTELYPNGSANGCDSIVFVSLSFDSNITEFLNQTLCSSDSVIVNGVTYDIDNPNGNEMIAGGSSNGCDSSVVVNLNFHPDPSGIFEATLCSGDSVIINGVTYNESNPTGSELLNAASTTGCDSTVNINLSFFSPIIENINQTLCPGDSLIINGVTYNESNFSGMELLAGGSTNGCDSTIFVNLDFYDPVITTFDPFVCSDARFEINSTTYDFDNPNGTEILTTANGCDSTININLNFYPENPGFITDTLCTEQGIFINGNPYNESNPSGTEILQGASSNGCDSTVIINLTFIQISEGLLNSTLCPGDSVVINGVVYNEENPTGIQFFENQAASGCDSSVIIDLNYYEDIPGNFTSTLCPGDSIIFNGVTYNESNPTGTEILQGAGINGCDSTLNINLNYFSESLIIIDDVLCEHESLLINNELYNIDNPNGTEIISNGSNSGCDSTIIIDLTFNLEVNSIFDQTLCPGDSIVVNNIVYNEDNPSGTETFIGGAASGCDSIITIDLNFHPVALETIAETLCDGESITVNGTVYNASNAIGTEVIENGSQNGCDSIIDINLNFYPQAMGFFNPTICQGGTFEYNGETFSADNPTSIVTLENASINGCDSIVDFQLSFYSLAESDFSTTLCDGDSLFFNGSIFHAAVPSGIITLENASSTGCDSTINVLVDFHDPVVFEINQSICEGSEFELGGQSFSETGTYEVVLENAAQMGCDSSIVLQLEILDTELLGAADAGSDITQCENTVILNANLPNTSTGLWESMENLSLENPENPNVSLENLSPGYHQFIWTLSSGQCTNYDSDTIQVYIQESPDAIDDRFILDVETSAMELDFLQNDNLSNNEAWTFDLIDTPDIGLLEELEEGVFQFTRNGSLGAELLLQYELCDEDCPNLCDSAFVEISLALQSIEDLDIPNAITPNGDGVNEMFMFPHLEFEPDRYPDKELIIFNRWGDIVYEAQPYLNDWNGVGKNGVALPQGTYYYVLRLDIATGIILKGDVSILK